MKKKCINPPSLFNSQQYGFSQIVTTKPGKMIFVSGQVAWDAQQHIVGEQDLAKQTQKALDNLKIAIETAGGTLADIVMLRIYKVNFRQEDGPIISQLLKSNFGTENLPASTWVSVQGLANPHFMIEIEAQAVI